MGKRRAAPVGISIDLVVATLVQDGYGFFDTLASSGAIRGSEAAGDLTLEDDA